MLKAPRFSRSELSMLKILLRIDYTRALRLVMEKSKEETEDETTSKVLTLTDTLIAFESPMATALSVSGAKGLSHVVMPLSDENFDFFKRICSVKLTDTDIAKMVDLVSATAEDFRTAQALLAETLENAITIDTDTIQGNLSTIPNPDYVGGGLKN